MSRSTRHLCKTPDMIAGNHESAAIAVMRAAERIGDKLLKQQLLNVTHRMILDAAQLRNAREEIAEQGLRLAPDQRSIICPRMGANRASRRFCAGMATPCSVMAACRFSTRALKSLGVRFMPVWLSSMLSPV